MYKVTQISKGFWSDAESDSAQQIRNLPKVLSYCQTFEKEVITVTNCSNSLETTLHAILAEYLEKKTGKPVNSISSFKFIKICEMRVEPKSGIRAAPLELNLYHVFSDNVQGTAHFVLVDPNGQDVAYARFAYHTKSPHLEPAYVNLPFLVIDAIASRKRGAYALGTVLVQAVFEYSLSTDCEGRVSLYSANKSGEFYFKLGFTPLKEPIFDKLYFDGEKNIDGEIMFLTDAANEAWRERAQMYPLIQPAFPNSIIKPF
ncbi:GNAT family N-acetyltransferase [Legionella feeleii]|uniref:Uncharacterized protein n=1 Tax=Legionella feeleii TaxID=453 RepID=A0A0W0TN97_9GAMM|nr:GNAT family N-acetyltransferase [Legionella feeleii]KTC96709.1 hypothetical protein Lfee_1621 [Legionella feeleii]SPX60620.1 Uncharacterised protein [Legionella feeleii]